MSQIVRINAAATADLTASGWQGYTGQRNNPASAYNAIRFNAFPENLKLRNIENIVLKNALKFTYPDGQAIVQANIGMNNDHYAPVPDYTGAAPAANTAQGAQICTRNFTTFTPGMVFDDYYTVEPYYDNYNAWLKEIIKSGVIVKTTVPNTKYTYSINSYYGVGSSKAPYLEVTVSDTDAYLYPTNPSPASGYINDEAENVFTWDIDISQEAYDRSGLHRL